MKPKLDIDLSKIIIGFDPVVSRASTAGKYDDLFRRMQPGQSLELPADWTDKVAQALRKYLEVNKKTGRVKSSRKYSDGKGRVWWMPQVRNASK